MNKKILLVGSSTMDLSMNVARVPDKGETLIDDGGVAYTPGGGAATAAAAFIKLGASCALSTKLGEDVHGQRMFNYYKSQKIDTAYIKVDHDYPTGFSVVIKETDGTKRTVIYPGANAQLNTDNVLNAFESNPDALYLSFEIPFSIALSAAKIASTKGIPIFVDASPADKSYPLENLPPVEVFTLNEKETAAFTGIEPAGTDSCLRAAYKLHQMVKCRYIVIKLGPRGSFIYDGKHCNMIPAFKPDKVTDTTAAGDSYSAALTLAYLNNGGNIVNAVSYAAAASAITVSRRGAAASLPTEEEVIEFINRKKF